MAAADTSEVVLTSETLPMASWPHAVVDCPSSWSSSSPTPCASCFCFVCDLPFSACDDAALHECADGTKEAWRRAKRRRSTLLTAWRDIPALVNLIVQLSVDEANRHGPGSPVAFQGSESSGSPTFVEMTAAFGEAKFGVKEPGGDAGIIKGMSDVCISDLYRINKDHQEPLYTECEFVNAEVVVDHVQNELCMRKLVKSEIVSPVVNPAPE